MTPLTNASPFFTASLMRHGSDLRAQIDTATDELTTGQKRDIGSALNGDFNGLSGIDSALARIEGHGVAIAEANLLAQATHAALQTLDDAVQGLATDMMTTSVGWTMVDMSAFASAGHDVFDTVISMLNTRVADRSLFGGVNSGVAPLPDSESLLATIAADIGTPATADDARLAIEAWFADPAGFAALYQGGAPRTGINVAEGSSVALDITALDPALVDTLTNLAGIALLDTGLFHDDATGRRTLLDRAAAGLFTASEDRASLIRRTGVAEARIEDARVRNATEKTALNIARGRMIEADPYETITRLKDLEARLDALYTVTARLSRLSLAEYLR